MSKPTRPHPPRHVRWCHRCNDRSSNYSMAASGCWGVAFRACLPEGNWPARTTALPIPVHLLSSVLRGFGPGNFYIRRSKSNAEDTAKKRRIASPTSKLLTRSPRDTLDPIQRPIARPPFCINVLVIMCLVVLGVRKRNQ